MLAADIGVSYMALWRAEGGHWPERGNRDRIFAWLLAHQDETGAAGGEGSADGELAHSRPVEIWLDDDLWELIIGEMRRLGLTRSAYVALVLRGQLAPMGANAHES